MATPPAPDAVPSYQPKPLSVAALREAESLTDKVLDLFTRPSGDVGVIDGEHVGTVLRSCGVYGSSPNAHLGTFAVETSIPFPTLTTSTLPCPYVSTRGRDNEASYPAARRR